MAALSKIDSKIRAVRHKTFMRCFSHTAPYYLVNEYPKSGGTWLAQMLADALELPFRRNEPIRLERAVTHGHFLNPLGLKKPIIMWRDPRDVIVSYYFHSYFINEHHNAKLVEKMKLSHPFDNYADIRSNLPQFIVNLTQSPISPKFSWPDFARVWVNRETAIQTSYEKLRHDTCTELRRIVNALNGTEISQERADKIVQAHSFAASKTKSLNKTNGKTEMSFLREGSIGGWKKHFSSEAEAVLDRMGYRVPMGTLFYE